MDNLENSLIQAILPLDKRIQDLSRSLEVKDLELDVLKNAYKSLLKELGEIVGPARYAYFTQKLELLPDENDLSDEEKLTILKLFDFGVPIEESDFVTRDKINALKRIIQDTDLISLLTSPLLRELLKSAEFYMLINNNHFRDLMTEDRLLTLIRSVEFKDLIRKPNFKDILARNGLILPLRPFDLQLPFRISILKSIAKLERIFEDFWLNRCAEYIAPTITKPARSKLGRSLSPSNNLLM